MHYSVKKIWSHIWQKHGLSMIDVYYVDCAISLHTSNKWEQIVLAEQVANGLKTNTFNMTQFLQNYGHAELVTHWNNSKTEYLYTYGSNEND